MPTNYVVITSAPLKLHEIDATTALQTFYFSTKYPLASNTVGIAAGKFCEFSLSPYLVPDIQLPIQIYAPNWEVIAEALEEFGPFGSDHKSNVSLCMLSSLLL